MVGRSGPRASRQATLCHPRASSRSLEAKAAQGSDFPRTVHAEKASDEAMVRRSKQMSAVVAAAVAVSCVSVGFGLWQSAASQSAVDQATKQAESVLVTTRDVKAGESIAATDLEARSVPAAYRSSAALPAEGADASISGAHALVDIPAGSQLCADFVAGVGSDGRLAAQVGSGMEAVSLSVDDETGVAGQVKPYDKVRIVSTEEASSGAMELQVLVDCARVLAVGGDGYVDGASYSAITVEVDSNQADAICQAQVSGRVSVLLLPSDSLAAGGAHG